jgi:hypothetical protein
MLVIAPGLGEKVRLVRAVMRLIIVVMVVEDIQFEYVANNGGRKAFHSAKPMRWGIRRGDGGCGASLPRTNNNHNCY